MHYALRDADSLNTKKLKENSLRSFRLWTINCPLNLNVYFEVASAKKQQGLQSAHTAHTSNYYDVSESSIL